MPSNDSPTFDVPIAGVDDAPTEDELCEHCGTRKATIHLESASANELCEACYIAMLERLLKRERERPESSVEAVVKVLRGEFGHLPSVDAAVLDYSARRVLAALRAVPVEGGEPVCYAATRDGHPVLPNAIRAHKHEAQRHAELLGPEFYAVPLYAHAERGADLTEAMVERACNVLGVGTEYTTVEINAAGVRAALQSALATPTPSEDRPDAR